MSLNEEDSENVIEIRTVSDEEIVINWATQHKISKDAIDKLFKEGFTSMEALLLLEDEDLGRTKIPRGQQKLILAGVQKLSKSTQRAGESTNVQTSVGGDVTQEESLTSRVTRQPRDPNDSQSALAGNHAETSGNGAALQPSNKEDAFTTLLNSLQSGQSLIRNNNVASNQDNILSGLSLSGCGLNANSLPLTQSAVSQSQSWKDPQIFLESAASGKSVPTHYDICDFISNQVEEEIVVGGNGVHQVVLKSGPRRPKLENVTLAQWSVANLAILYKLVAESKLHAGNILDYLSYTTKICQLVQRFTLISVLLYDREYRQLQARHGFRWGTDVPHFHSIHLQPRLVRQSPVAQQKGVTGTQKNTAGPAHNLTLDGKVICKLFNSKSGCHYKECKFVHKCSHSGCHQYHSAQTHNQSKN